MSNNSSVPECASNVSKMSVSELSKRILIKHSEQINFKYWLISTKDKRKKNVDLNKKYAEILISWY